MSDADLCYLTIADSAQLIRSGALSPVELAEAILARIEVLDPRISAFLHVDGDLVLSEARRAEQELSHGSNLGPLHGVPVAIKDIVDVAGLPTTAGSRVLAGHVATEDAAVVAALRSAGAIILGKTNTHEFAYGVITAPTRNPWNLDRIPGGSSGGSAAALAAGMAPGAIGTDTGGSIRLPAALCGVVGLKPTYGRISRHGVIPLSWSLDHVGPLTRTVADAAMMLEAMVSGCDPHDPATSDVPLPPLAEALRADVRGLRVGVAREYFFDQLETSVAVAVDEALLTLTQLGLAVRDVRVPDIGLTFGIARAIQRPEASAYHRERLREQPELYGDELRRDLELGQLFLAVDYVHAQRVRAQMRERWYAAMDGIDVLAVPTVPIGAPEAPAGTTSGAIKGKLLRNTYPVNLTGFPAISVPCGFTGEGLPIGLQIVGRPYDEAAVLRVGHAYERATDWRTMRPRIGG